MALTPTDNEAFFREVDDDLRRDRLTRFWRRWGRVVLILIGIGLAVLAAFLWWRDYRAKQAGAEGEQLTAVLADIDQGKGTPGDPRLMALAGSSHDGYRATARLAQAGIAARINPADAAARYRAIADDTGLPRPTRDLAMLRATTLQFDTLPPAQVIARLQPLAAPGSPWFGSAAELTAAAYIKLNRADRAGPLFAAIARDQTVPASLRGRAAGMATALGQTVAPPAPAASTKE